MAKRGSKPRKPRVLKIRRKSGPKIPQTYKHERDKLLLRPDVGLQPQFKPKRPPKNKAYTHQTNWVSRLILGDSLVVMNSLLENPSGRT